MNHDPLNLAENVPSEASPTLRDWLETWQGFVPGERSVLWGSFEPEQLDSPMEATEFHGWLQDRGQELDD